MGKALPGKLLTNDTVETNAGMPPGSIEQKTGIKSRYIAEADDTCSGLAAQASRQALTASGVTADQIGLILGCTFTADYVMPALACKVHQILGTKQAAAFDIMANCTAFQIGLNVAADKMQCDESISHALVIGAALQSRFVNWKDANSSIYFGDGAGAAVLGRVPHGYGFLAHDAFSNTAVYESVRIRGGGSSYPMRAENVGELLNYYEIHGMDVWKQVIQNQPIVIKRVLRKAGLALGDVDFFIFHQANLHLITYLMGKMKVPMDRTYTNVAEIGNTAEASMAIALCEAAEKTLIKKGDVVLVSGVGAGFTFGASVMRWYSA